MDELAREKGLIEFDDALLAVVREFGAEITRDEYPWLWYLVDGEAGRAPV